MGRPAGPAFWWGFGINDDAGAPALQTGKAHRQPLAAGRGGLHPGGGQSLFQPPDNPPPAAVKPGQSAIGMAQGAHGLAWRASRQLQALDGAPPRAA